MAKGLLDGGSNAISLNDLNEGLSAEELANQSPDGTGVVETKEEPKEDPKEEPKAEPQQEPKGEPKPDDPPAGQFDFAFFNKTLNTNYESLDQVKTDLEKPTMESEYNEVKSQLDEWQQKYNDLNSDFDALTEQLDPSAYFSSDEAMKLEVFKKENPDKDASIAQRIFSTEDLSSIGDLDMVKMGWRFNTPTLKGTDKDLEAAIAEELNQDPETPLNEWPVSAQNRLARMAADYSHQFKTIKSSVKPPEKIDLAQLKADRAEAQTKRQAELTEKWEAVANESLSTTDVKLPIGTPKEGEEQQFFTWTLGDAPKEEVDALKERYISMGFDPEENKEAFQQTLNLALIDKNLPQIMLKYGEDLLARQEERHLDETNNTNPLKDSERTDLTDEEKEKLEQTNFALTPEVPSFKGSPLFKPTK